MRGHGVQVLIVGAGLAGLVAARTLTEWGAEVRIVEERFRISAQPGQASALERGN